MSKIESKDYWQEFFKKYPDPSPIREFINKDPILIEFWNLSVDPLILNADFNKYPFDEKLNELQTITSEDKKYLEDLVIQEGANGGDQSEWLDYLYNQYEVVRQTINLYKAGQDKGYPHKIVVAYTERAFRTFIAIHEEIILKRDSYTGNSLHIIGKYWPDWMLHILREEDLKTGALIKTEAQIHFPAWRELTKPDVDRVFDLDRFSVLTIQRYGKTVITPSFTSPGQDQIVRLYHRGRPVSEPFIFP